MLQPTTTLTAAYVPPVLPIPPPGAYDHHPPLEGDDVCPGCNKKANKECQFRRCRGCCLKKIGEPGWRCAPHIRDTDRRPTRISNSIINKALTESAQVQRLPSAITAQLTPAPALRALPPQMLQHMQHTQQMPQHLILQQPPSPEIPKPEVSKNAMVECPRCHKVISILGANLWLHVKECDPDHLMSYIHLQTANRLIPDVIDKNKPEPLKIAKQNAAERYYRNLEFLEHIFSPTPIEDTLVELCDALSNTEELKETYENYSTTLSHMESLLTKHDNFLESFQHQTQSFYQHLDKLEKCTTEEELEICKKAFEAEFSVYLDENPLLYPVTQKKVSGGGDDVEMMDVSGPPQPPIVLQSL